MGGIDAFSLSDGKKKKKKPRAMELEGSMIN